jgi:hypothetical protein
MSKDVIKSPTQRLGDLLFLLRFLLLLLLLLQVWTQKCAVQKCGCQYFILLTLKKKKSWTQGSWIFFNKKLILDYYFCLKSSPVFLFQIFIIAPLPLPRDIQLYH